MKRVTVKVWFFFLETSHNEFVTLTYMKAFAFARRQQQWQEPALVAHHQPELLHFNIRDH